jgi:hypothetical protein
MVGISCVEVPAVGAGFRAALSIPVAVPGCGDRDRSLWGLSFCCSGAGVTGRCLQDIMTFFFLPEPLYQYQYIIPVRRSAGLGEWPFAVFFSG